MLPKIDFEIDILRPVDVVFSNPLSMQASSATTKVKGDNVQAYRVDRQLYHQRGKSALVFSCLIEKFEGHAHKSRMHRNSRISSSSPIFSSHEATRKGSLLLLDAGKTHKHILCRPYRKLLITYFANVETKIFFHTVLWWISKLAVSPLDSGTEVTMEVVSVKTLSRKLEVSSKSRNQFDMVNKGDSEYGTKSYMNKKPDEHHLERNMIPVINGNRQS